MATMMQIVDAVVARLKAKLPQLAAEYFPDNPDEYRLNHPKGALLVSYPGSTFDDTVDVGCVAQPRMVKLSVTVVMRQLNGRGGAVDMVDAVLLALVGWRPPDCRKANAKRDAFLNGKAGIWQYAVDLTAETMFVEDAEGDDGPLLTHITTDDDYNRGETRKEPDGSIIQEEFTV